MAARKKKQSRSVAALVPIGLLIVVALVAYVLLRPVTPKHHSAGVPGITCPAAADVAVGTFVIPAGPIAGYCQPQLENAAEVILAARAWGLNQHAQEIGLMTAIGESGLRNLDFGDVAGPDSRGLFQQRSNYGTLADRLDPYTASYAFFARMRGVADWWSRPPTEVAHAVQENADPNYYTQFWTRAEALEFGIRGAQLFEPHPPVLP